ncbi:hypothetical protein SO802_030569 [Lithocarpus litseifolius]|uniref:Uncharacterized protein n=1 Tax=Lithocarpus litseifolius TaxID=425828 RepID=A0AAW2BJN0_9ROSI
MESEVNLLTLEGYVFLFLQIAASHLDTVLDKLKDTLDNVGQGIFQRFLSIFSDSFRAEESDDIHAAWL